MVYAQSSSGGIDLSNPSQNPIAKFDSIATFVNVIIPLVTLIGALTFFVMLLYGGFTFMTAGGNPESVKKAQKIFGFSIAGFFMMVFAYFFVKLMTRLLNIDTPLP